MRVVGFNTQQVRQGVCQRGGTQHQGLCSPGLIGPDALAYTIVQLHVCDLKALCNSTIRALAQARGLAPNVTGTIDAINLETTARHEGHGHVTRMQKVTDTRG